MLSTCLAGLAKQSVGIADLTVCSDPHLVLVAASLGTGLAVAIYDPLLKVGGLLHAMLPDSSLDPARATAKPGLFLDTGLHTLLKSAFQLRANPSRLEVYVAGGAQLIGASHPFDLGLQNYEALVPLLKKYDLKIAARDVGGHESRTLFLVLQTGEVRIRNSGQSRETALCKS